MRKIVFLMGLMLLAGCAGTDENAARLAQRERLSYLSGKSENQIRRVLGTPVLTRTEEPYQLWAYRTAGCSTLVYFDTTGQSQFVDVRGDCRQMLARAF